MSIPCLRCDFGKPCLQVGRGGWRSVSLHASHFPGNHLGMLCKSVNPIFSLTSSNLRRTGLFCLCNPIVDCRTMS